MNTEQLTMALSETLDLQDLLNRAIEKRNEQYRLEAERLQQERLARLTEAQENVALCTRVYQATVKDALDDAVNRQSLTRFCPSDTEKAMLSGQIAFDSAKIRSTSWRYFSEFHGWQVQKARHSLAMARQKLARFAGA